MMAILIGMVTLIAAVILTLAVMAVLEWRWQQWYKREAAKPLASPKTLPGICARCERIEALQDNGDGVWICAACQTREDCET